MKCESTDSVDVCNGRCSKLSVWPWLSSATGTWVHYIRVAFKSAYCPFKKMWLMKNSHSQIFYLRCRESALNPSQCSVHTVLYTVFFFIVDQVALIGFNTDEKQQLLFLATTTVLITMESMQTQTHTPTSRKHTVDKNNWLIWQIRHISDSHLQPIIYFFSCTCSISYCWRMRETHSSRAQLGGHKAHVFMSF